MKKDGKFVDPALKADRFKFDGEPLPVEDVEKEKKIREGKG